MFGGRYFTLSSNWLLPTVRISLWWHLENMGGDDSGREVDGEVSGGDGVSGGEP